MERRNALKLAAVVVAGGAGAGVVTLSSGFKPEVKPATKPTILEFKNGESIWRYTFLDPAKIAELAYNDYSAGSCMYGVFNSIISQLSEKIGEPFASFPTQMMKYGHGGVNGSGTICGTLNGAAALLGLLVEGKGTQDTLMAELFRLYENSELPIFNPNIPVMDYTPPTSVARSALCHASTTRWGKATGFRIDSNERKERCRRLTADIAAQTVTILNDYHQNAFVANAQDNETVRTCMTCHGNEGKLGNTTGKMECTPCHTESVGHKLFGDIHYSMMKE